MLDSDLTNKCLEPYYRDFLVQLVSRKVLENPALDIVRMILAGESWRITKKQSQVFRYFVYNKYKDNRCKKCKRFIYWGEMVDAIYNNYLCDDCFWGHKE